MSIRQFCLVAATSFGLCVVPIGHAFAQQAPGPGEAPGKIQLDVAVTTPKGEPVGSLSEKDFTVLDNQSQGPIASFTPVEGKDAQVRVVIVLDAANSPITYVGYQRDQIVKYLRSNQGVLPYPTSLAILTDSKLEVITGAGNDGNVLADKLEHADIGLHTITRNQGYYGAVDKLVLSLSALRNLIQAQGKLPGRKLMVWVSPGWPLVTSDPMLLRTQSPRAYHTAIEFSTYLREANITLYSINGWGPYESVGGQFAYQGYLKALKGPVGADWGNLSLQVLATQSGGLVLNTNDVVAMIQRCVADADQYYRIVLDTSPAAGPNAYHQIEVKVAQSGLVARTRQGYYAQP